MNLIRCDQCGEIADLTQVRVCAGCGLLFSTDPMRRAPRQMSPMRREALSDIGMSKALLIGLLVGGGGLGLTLLFFKETGSMSVAIPIGLVLAVLYPILSPLLKTRAETPNVTGPIFPPSPAGGAPRIGPPGASPPPVVGGTGKWKCATCGSEVEEQFDACWNCAATKSEGAGKAAPARTASPRFSGRPASARPAESLGTAIESGCGMVLKVVGIMIAVLLGLAALGFVILWIACMNVQF